jgi:hypothetical protein
MTLPKITNKQQEILTLLYRFRFLNRIQIQSLLNHKDYKTINTWLKDLNEKDYIQRIYSTKYGEINKPAIYYVSLNGIKYLKTLDECSTEQIRKLHREKERSSSFIDQSIFIAGVCLELREKSEATYTLTTNSDFANHNSLYHFLTGLNPNLAIAKKDKKKGISTKYYILENIQPTLPRHSIRKRIKSYFDFYFSNEWEENISKKFPVILIICPTLSSLINVKIITKKLISEDDLGEDIDIRFAVLDEVKKYGIDGEVWESAS